MSNDKKKGEKDCEHVTFASGKRMTKKTWIMASLRRAGYRWPEKAQAERDARVDRGLYKCAMCGESFKSKEYAIDHIEPVVPHTGFPLHPITGGPDWTIIIERMFCDKEGFQILCLVDHDLKSSIEDKLRSDNGAKRKEEAKLQKKLDKQKKVK